MQLFIDRLKLTDFPTFNFEDFNSDKVFFEKLCGLDIIKPIETLSEISCDLCFEEHTTKPIKSGEDEIFIVCFGNTRPVNKNELYIWGVNRKTLEDNIISKKPVISKKDYENTIFAKKIDERFFIVREGQSYRYNGVLLNLKNNEPKIVFDCLYDFAEQGGDVRYSQLGEKVKKVIKKTKNYKIRGMTKYLQSKLTDNSNGFMSFVNRTEKNNKPLISADPKQKSFYFNNSKLS